MKKKVHEQIAIEKLKIATCVCKHAPLFVHILNTDKTKKIRMQMQLQLQSCSVLSLLSYHVCHQEAKTKGHDKKIKYLR
jgi:hypothetical protein